MYERSKELIRGAIASVMAEFYVDRETARYWVQSAAEVAAA